MDEKYSSWARHLFISITMFLNPALLFIWIKIRFFYESQISNLISSGFSVYELKQNILSYEMLVSLSIKLKK